MIEEQNAQGQTVLKLDALEVLYLTQLHNALRNNGLTDPTRVAQCVGQVNIIGNLQTELIQIKADLRKLETVITLPTVAPAPPVSPGILKQIEELKERIEQLNPQYGAF